MKPSQAERDRRRKNARERRAKRKRRWTDGLYRSRARRAADREL